MAYHDGRTTVHAFRKSCGQNWANHVPMIVVQDLMGHADIGTTAKFNNTVAEEHEMKAQRIIEAITIGQAGKKSDTRMSPDPVLSLNRKVV